MRKEKEKLWLLYVSSVGDDRHTQHIKEILALPGNV